MQGWVMKSVAVGATKSLGFRQYIASQGKTWIRCEIQDPPYIGGIKGMVEIDLRTPLRGPKARLRVPIDAVMFEHKQLRRSWPLRAWPAFQGAWQVSRSCGSSQHMLRIMLQGSEGKEKP